MSKPVLCILGSTATGKSKLAIELALRFNGEIISADSMQLYKGLDIVTNKVTKDEQKQVKHHFLSILEPTEVYTVSDFKKQADNIIKQIHGQNKMPIIVGELIERQHSDGGGDAKISGRLRFPDSLIFNLNVDKSVLHKRIDRRVDDMLNRGLIKELTDFYDTYHHITNQKKYDYMDLRKGIFQVIGFKEFDDYFKYTKKNELKGEKVTDPELINNEAIETKLINRGLNNLRAITKKYSKTQLDWFSNRILSNINRRPTPPVFQFDVNELDKWHELVFEPSAEIVEHLLIEQKSIDSLPEHLTQYRAKELKKDVSKKMLRYCQYCDKSMVEELTWNKHINSKRHRIMKQKWRIDKFKKLAGISLTLATVVMLATYYMKK